MAKHTPGPWKAEKQDIFRNVGHKNGAFKIVAGEILICMFPWARTTGQMSEESEANAHLIAASPDMLEALERANKFITNGIEFGYIRLPDVDCPDPAHETPGIIRDAIAKAKGESHEQVQD